jgi:hypothetical protein
LTQHTIHVVHPDFLKILSNTLPIVQQNERKNLSNTLPIQYNVPVIEDNKPAARWLVLINQALNGTADANANVFQHEP